MENTDISNGELESLKKENTYLLAQLTKLNQKLEESDSFKSHFISNITNEIVNPFTSILGISKNIIGLGANKISQIHSMANLIYNEAFDLDFQLQNIFAAAKIESGEINLELTSIEPIAFVENIIESLRFKSEKKAQYIEIIAHDDVPSNFVTDEEKFNVIIKNIITNAIIFGDDKTRIGVNIEGKDDQIIIKVNNKGSLIDKEELDKIFDRFTKLDKNINSVNQGHGLGLSVTKSYLEFLDGEISVESDENIGNTFSVVMHPSENNSDSLIRDDDLFIDDSEIF